MANLEICLRFVQVFWVILVYIFESAAQIVPTGRIAGGIGIDITKANFTVQVLTKHQCGGSLITPLLVVTAAHCIHNVVKPSDVTVIGGATHLRKRGLLRKVHSIYTPLNWEWDIAILKLDKVLEGPNIGTIKLCDTQFQAGDLFKVYGWGKTKEFKFPFLTSNNESFTVPHLRVVEVPVVAYKQCASHFNVRLPNFIFCAGIPGEKNSCSGDSGGPAVFNNQLCGIVSSGGICPDLGLYVNINRVKSFIQQVLKSNTK